MTYSTVYLMRCFGRSILPNLKSDKNACDLLRNMQIKNINIWKGSWRLVFFNQSNISFSHLTPRQRTLYKLKALLFLLFRLPSCPIFIQIKARGRQKCTGTPTRAARKASLQAVWAPQRTVIGQLRTQITQYRRSACRRRHYSMLMYSLAYSV